MRAPLANLISRLDDPALSEANVISWGSPIPSFGDLSRSKVATLGLNPSNREFVDAEGNELDGGARRFHTLRSLGIEKWTEATYGQHQLILETCCHYFSRNPYDGWFKSLDRIISGTTFSYYDDTSHACHLDLIPYATACKWTELNATQRSALLTLVGDTLGILLKKSCISILVLNGKSVVENLENMTNTSFNAIEMPDWVLPRRDGIGVMGVAYTGTVNEIGGIKLGREIHVLGYNHNIQSSFGVTTRVKEAIRDWITESAYEILQ